VRIIARLEILRLLYYKLNTMRDSNLKESKKKRYIKRLYTQVGGGVIEMNKAN
jgi:hypothetical protein